MPKFRRETTQSWAEQQQRAYPRACRERSRSITGAALGAGDAANAILSAVGYNFRRILAWLRDLLSQILIAILRLSITRSKLIPAS